jgi:hypothetical protein
MASFSVEDVDVSVNEFLSQCSTRERDQLIQLLIDDDDIREDRKISDWCPSEEIFEENLNILHGKWNRLTNEEEQIIMNIAKRFA